jgi:AbrB family looped-hinge helix DNA binding protein
MPGVTVVTRKGQITIPADVWRALGLREGDRVSVVVEGGHARIQRAGGVIARTGGIVKTSQPPLSDDELREQTESAIAADAIERMESE